MPKLKNAPTFTIDAWPPWAPADEQAVWTLKRQMPAVEHVERVYVNQLYCVMICRQRQTPFGVCTPVMIRNREGMPVRSWAHVQRIKNEVLGPERWAFEVYPPKSGACCAVALALKRCLGVG